MQLIQYTSFFNKLKSFTKKKKKLVHNREKCKDAYLAATTEKITNYYQRNHPNNSSKLSSQK